MNTVLHFRASWRARQEVDGSRDRGYSIVEVLVALTILAVVLVAAEWGVIASMSAATVAKEHSVATGLVAGAMAEAVAIPFTDLQNGLNPTVDNLSTGDPNIEQVGSSYVLKLNGSIVPTSSSTIPTSNANTSEAPIVPHEATVVQGIPYQVSTYPTVTPSAPGLVTVVVVVTWKSPTGATLKVVGEDRIAAP